jgi:hypothetical protein
VSNKFTHSKSDLHNPLFYIAFIVGTLSAEHMYNNKLLESIMPKLLSIITLILLLSTTSASAGIISYSVSDAMNNAGTDIGHGLYTFGKNNTGQAKYSIQSGTFFNIDTKDTLSNNDDTATLIGTAFNGTHTAIINLSFSGFKETQGYKKEHGKDYNANPGLYDINGVLASMGNGDIDFFGSISGNITINNITHAINTCTNCGDNSGLFGLQFGDGANAKNSADFGGSAWVGVGNTPDKSSHWDLNLKFTQVPEPSSFLLFSLALFGFYNKKRKSIKNH